MTSFIVAAATAYLLGSIPFAFLLARRRGIDLRRAGSGNVGASNVLRTSGVSLAVLAIALDGLKGTLAVLIAERVSAVPAAPVAAGLASVLGHVYPVWLRFHGGKGVATAAGVFTLLAPAALTAAAAVFAIAVVATRVISVGSVSAAVTLPIATALMDAPRLVVAGAVLAAAIIVYSHRANLARLVAGTERRVGGA
ncbi:MAG TPA: glycerol-3-phosphate 1-O-acyltransferase PlsY [Vicinamibacterales bacterium]|nr:glycerol-3-phosphate 1-O-acyltransferase PlsY [Vicinamibacterales bacterium]